MLQPSEIVGREFLVSIVSDLGPMARRVKAFNAEDAQAQMEAYCLAEGLQALEISVN